MDSELKAILDKGEDQRTKADEKKISEAVAAFQKEIKEVCERHGLQYQATAGLVVTVMPVLEVVK